MRMLIWTPESDNDVEAVRRLAEKVCSLRQIQIEIHCGKRRAYQEAARYRREDPRQGLLKAAETYRKEYDLILFSVDADGEQTLAERRKQPHSHVSLISWVARKLPGTVFLVLMRQELEAWLLVDTIGVCCHYCGHENVRNQARWIEFAKKEQIGDTQKIVESVPGGSGAKEHLISLSKKILLKKNPRMKDCDLHDRKYSEHEAGSVAASVEISEHTLQRNASLRRLDAILLAYASGDTVELHQLSSIDIV